MKTAASSRKSRAKTADRPLEVLVIGAGFSGLCMGIQLRQAGVEDFLILDKEDDVGGTWLVNSYPGCACDVQSHLYSFSFEPNPAWSRMFAPQPEIWRYLRHCADKYGLGPHLRLRTEVSGARYDENKGLWTVSTVQGRMYTTRNLVMGVGGLSRPAIPKLRGLEKFKGEQFHSQQWNHAYDLKGKRVAVVGTGASAIQFVPQIAPEVAQLDLYQRTPPWVLPKPDRRMRKAEQILFKRLPLAQRALRAGLYAMLETRVLGFEFHQRFMELPRRWALAHIRRHIADPVLREKLTPDYTIGCKRVLMSNDYYPALARPNVEVLTAGIREVKAHSIVGSDGQERPVDAIIFGTGFEVQNPIPRGVVFGRGGVDIADAWKDGPEAYKGLSVSGFPNLFILLGPNTGLGHNSIIYMIESQVHYVMQLLQLMKRRKLRAADVKPAVQQRFNERLQQRLKSAVWTAGGCKSWYLNDNGKNTTLWPGFTFRYRQMTRRLKPADYALTPA